ncbi:MAG: transcriptional repressor [Lachnospiraceae bacterium]|nr:transcriptional repressor [Lachnospiraceae bacterium]
MESKTTRSKYKTKQRSMLIDFFSSNKGKHITAGDVCNYFKEQGSSIGQSTVYRQLDALVEEGIINKYIVDPNSPACFEYVGEGVHNEEDTCFHAKCEKCGKLIHMHCEELLGIKDHLHSGHGFELDPMRTVFYGLCEDCNDKVVLIRK